MAEHKPEIGQVQLYIHVCMVQAVQCSNMDWMNLTFKINSRKNMPKNIASVEMKNIGMEDRSEVVSIAIVMQLRRMVAIIRPLNTVVYRRKK